MTSDKKPSPIEFESQVKKVTSSYHQREIHLITDVLNIYVDSFNLVDTFTFTEENEVESAWLLLVTRSFQSMRCACQLMLMGYYRQAISLLRTITENIFICHDCINNTKTLEAVLYNKYKIPDSNQGLSFRQMAKRTGNMNIYESDYDHQSRVNHPTALSLGILTDPKTNELRAAPSYDNILFLDCCEQFFRIALLMAEIMGWLLSNIAKNEVSSWRDKTNKKCKLIVEWLSEIREKYGEQTLKSDSKQEAS